MKISKLRFAWRGPMVGGAFFMGMVLFGAGLTPARATDALVEGFKRPPAESRPWVYWFPLDGNISSNGITADLEAMARVGIGGVLFMETDQGAPKGPARFGSPLWLELFQHACAEARRLGLQVNMHNNAGWTGSGGPWITPELSMQRIVWTETCVNGPQAIDIKLPQPATVADYYRDIVVYAYPAATTNYTLPNIKGKSAAEREEIPPRASFPVLAPELVIPRKQLLDLTSNMDADGRLRWNAPAGQWVVLRMGHTSTGKDNHPAPLEGRGLECDKLSPAAIEVHYRALMGKIVAHVGALAGTHRTLVSTHIDSWEVGSQNWTPRFREEFKRRRGYDPRPFLPVMTGRVVDSIEVSERFLWDMRQTVNDLLVDNYAGRMRALAHRDGLRLSIEAYNHSPCDDLTFAGRADEPMAEFWAWPRMDFDWSCTAMSSAAHVYGRPILGAEAFTSNNDEKWKTHPGEIKGLGDWAFCEGINRFVFHRYALQPWTRPDRVPGMSMGPWGLHYERTQTWWEMSRAWHEYLARCQFILQRGLFVADLCFLAPETSPQRFVSPLKRGRQRPGYNFDGCPPEVLLTRMQVKDGRLVLPDGMSYRMLVLPRVPTMTPDLLRKIRDLVQAGATVLGMPPLQSPGLRDYPRCDDTVRALARELWGDPAVVPEGWVARPVGRGRVIWGRDIQPLAEAPYENEPVLRAAKWIWFNEGRPASAAPPETRYFRRVVKIDDASPIESARLVMTGDNTFECQIDGVRVASGHRSKYGYSKNVMAWLKPGDNLFTVICQNAFSAPNPAGLIGVLKIRYRDGRTQTVVTDSGWEAARTVSDTWQTDTVTVDGWSAALELGPVGMPPWGAVEEGAPPVDSTLDIDVATRVLASMGLPPDFESSIPLNYIHKRLDTADVYFVANPAPHAVEPLCTFRIGDRQPELWWPDTGRVEDAGMWERMGDGRIRLALPLDPEGSVFVVFRKKVGMPPPFRADGNGLKFDVLDELRGPWEVRFPPGWGAPSHITLDRLLSWSEHADPGVRYFSGTATYVKEITISPDACAPGSRLYLDLGGVAVMAEVILNGQNMGILWKRPFHLDITGAVQPGRNALEIKVVNLWINRMIGDEHLPEDSARNPNGTLKEWPTWLDGGRPSPTGRFTFTSWRLWKKDDPLLESGLLGPVVLKRARERTP